MRFTTLAFSTVFVLCLGIARQPLGAAENCPPGTKPAASQSRPAASQSKTSASQSSAGAADEVQLSMAQKGKRLVTSPGAKLCLRLPGDRGNGSWALTKLAGGALEQVGKSEYIADSRDNPGKMGGVFVFHFKAAKSGRATIKASFTPTQKGKAPTNNYSVDIVVGKSTG
jgi:predicted secreted protein